MSNLRIIVKPCQSGKTFTKLTEIKKLISDEEEDSKAIHLIFTDNSILQTIQLKDRITPFLSSHSDPKDDLKTDFDDFNDFDDESDSKSFEEEDKKFVVIAFSSKSSRCSKPESLLPFLKKDKTKIIISCANRTRFNDMDIIVNSLKSHNFYIWIDEADKSISNQFSDMINRWLILENMKKMTFITATPEDLLKVYGDIELVPLKEAYDRDLYHRFIDSDIKIIELDKSKKEVDVEKDVDVEEVEEETIVNSKAVQYARQILVSEEDVKNNSRWFIPANHRMDTHDEMALMLLEEFGFTVVVVNGNGKFLYLPTLDDPVNIDEIIDTNCEVSKWLAVLYHEFIPSTTPFALTGKLCLGRGITLSSPDLIFSHAIFPPVLNGNSSSYQLAGRMSGNMKGWEGYQPPVIYCTSKFYQCIVAMEEAAIKLVEDDNKIATLDYYVEARGGNKKMTDQEDPIIKQINIYDMSEEIWKEEVKEFINYYYPKAKPRSCDEFFKSRVFEDGFLHDFFRGKKSQKIFTVDEIMINKSAGLGKKSRYRINVAYTDITDPHSGYIIVRVLPPPSSVEEDNI